MRYIFKSVIRWIGQSIYLKSVYKGKLRLADQADKIKLELSQWCVSEVIKKFSDKKYVGNII